MNRILLMACMLTALHACRLYDNQNIEPSEAFFRIYDSDPSTLYLAHDLKQTDDGGYVVLGSALDRRITDESIWRPYIMRLNEQGTIVWDTVLQHLVMTVAYAAEDELPSVTKSLFKAGNKYVFPCMKPLGSRSYTYSIYSFTEESPSFANVYDAPAGSNALRFTLGQFESDPTALLASTYSAAEGYSLRRLQSNFSESWHTNFSAGDQESEVFVSASTLLGSLEIDGKEWVYVRTIGAMADSEDADGERFMLHLFDPNDGSAAELGRNAQGAPINEYPYITPPDIFDEGEAVSLDLPVRVWSSGSNKLTVATISYGSDNAEILLPNVEVELDSSGKVNRGNTGFSSHEYRYSLPVYIEQMANEEGTRKLVYLGSTWEGKMLITVMAPDDSKVLGKKYLGHSSYYEARGFINTADGGYAVLGITLTRGRYQQICLIKESEYQKNIDFK